MADKSIPSLSEQYALPSEEKLVESKPSEVEKTEIPVPPAPEEVAPEKTEEAPAAVEESSGAPAAAAASLSSDAAPADAVQESSDESAPVTEETNEAPQTEESGSEDASEETPEVKLETAPADFRFPTTNQTRHCFTRYIEYHRCVAAKGEDASECDKFAKYYRSLCPGEWVDRWNEQRENGTFPGPL